MKFDVAIIGAGAAGMFCAAEAARRGKRVVLIEGSAAPGEKIRISGGGRCNFTNLGIARDCYLSQNPRFALSALKRFTQWDFIARVDAAGIAWHEKTLGQLFCDGSATQIISMLTKDLKDHGVELWLKTQVHDVSQVNDGFSLATSGGAVVAESLVIACGGKSIPKMGASSFGYKIAEQFGLPIVETRPGLVPLTFAEQDLASLKPLAGVAVDGAAATGKTRFKEALLFTHRGLSGPAILQISSYWREGQPISINLTGQSDLAAQLQKMRGEAGRIALRTALKQFLPERLARHIEELSGVTGNLADQSNVTLERVAQLVQDWQMRPVGTEGYRTAEVTLGGVDTDALNSKTMEAKSVSGLYFIGEVVDVTGWLGGYNFQWAWSSGWAAGQAL
ncbi:NAD(P)/FAD-dependent oxidoreductase [Pseudorhodobacter turbinis]|uniref:NAD(P)/FAD-dependent oxidoreductase n=1 Tax=Pseudorhodobacter turbinis TaxID=2500533 RepID=A0A4P8ED80_9RHOB|nr:NAD(P)/FAD-dependent oxidoreductase [Pseudorhodobacter turbinis]QCO54870.1 NAD(P)/FAD-dependent oxidoreductase [Pseudorhodobacter turbinis]